MNEAGAMNEVFIDYLNPDIPAGLRLLDVPVVRATARSLKGYGEIVRDPGRHRIEIVPWPLSGWRKLDAGTGIEGGTTEGIFACQWQGNELWGHNEAVNGQYVIGFRNPPDEVQQGVYVQVEDVDAHYARARAAGAEIVRPLQDTDYGSREYSVRDLEGHLWSFGTYQPG